MARFRLVVCMVAWLAIVPQFHAANAQVITTAIGGVEINPNGVLESPSVELVRESAQRIRDNLQRLPADLSESTDLRTVSLSGLGRQLDQAQEQNRQLPDEVRYLAGLTRVQYIIVAPESRDILLAGPAEPWDVSDAGVVVGKSSRRPILLLDDLLVALRSTEDARTVGITCSIDPTAEGRQQLQSLLSKQKQFRPGITKAVEQALGMQHITITGVPQDSHFARTLAAADFRMKRFAMMLEAAPVEGMPSFLELIRTRRGGLNSMMPRWWMAGAYEPVAKSSDGHVWEIRGAGVRVMTEDEIVSRSGGVTGSGKVNPVAQEWADNMTERYDELAKVDPVFGQLRNLMDLSLVAALIAREDLCGMADCPLESLMGASSKWKTEFWPAPRSVASQSSFIKVKRQYVITASGGVQIDSWSWAANTQVDPLLEGKSALVLPVPTDRWVW